MTRDQRVGGKIIGRPVGHRVLVTGCPRSGTTFLGTALALPASVDYLHEPLNPECGLPSVTSRYIDLADEPVARDEMQRLFDYEPLLRGAVYGGDQPVRRATKRLVRGRGPMQLTAARLNPWSRHQVIKDPFAVMSVPWFLSQHVATIAVVRHPAAVASSFRRLGWSTGRTLTRLAGIATDDERQVFATIDPSDQLAGAAALWRILVRRLTELEPNDAFTIVTHEAVSAEPVERLAEIRAAVGLPWSTIAGRRLERMTSGGSARSRRPQQLQRPSAEIFAASLADLEHSELTNIWRITEPVAHRWYDRDSVR